MANPDFARKFSALWSTNMGTSFSRIEAQIGRPLTHHDVELHNWAQAEFARGVNGVEYALGLAANVDFRRAVQQWWHDGWDLLLTAGADDPRRQAGGVHSRVQLQRSAGDQLAHALDRRRPAGGRSTGRGLRS